MSVMLCTRPFMYEPTVLTNVLHNTLAVFVGQGMGAIWNSESEIFTKTSIMTICSSISLYEKAISHSTAPLLLLYYARLSKYWLSRKADNSTSLTRSTSGFEKLSLFRLNLGLIRRVIFWTSSVHKLRSIGQSYANPFKCWFIISA